jgi:hypothetical protein
MIVSSVNPYYFTPITCASLSMKRVPIGENVVPAPFESAIDEGFFQHFTQQKVGSNIPSRQDQVS